MNEGPFARPGDEGLWCADGPGPGVQFVDAAASQRLKRRATRVSDADADLRGAGAFDESEERVDEIAAETDIGAHDPRHPLQHVGTQRVEAARLRGDGDVIGLCVKLRDGQHLRVEVATDHTRTSAGTVDAGQTPAAADVEDVNSVQLLCFEVGQQQPGGAPQTPTLVCRLVRGEQGA